MPLVNGGRMKRACEVALSSVLGLFFVSLYSFLGLPIEALPYYAAVSIVAMYALSKHNIWLGRKEFSENVVKPMVLDVEGSHIYQEIEFGLKYVRELMINFSGEILPLTISLFIMGKLMLMGAVSATVLIALVAFLTMAYNRITLFIRGRGLGVPMATAIAMSAGVVLSLYLGGYISKELAPIIAFAAGVPAALIGIDLMNLKNAALFKSRYVIIGGMGPADAIVMLPVMSALILKGLVSVI